MSKMVFEVHGEPRGQGRPRFSRFSKPYKAGADIEWEERIRSAFCEKASQCGWPMWSKKPIGISVTAYFEPPQSTSKKKRDAMLSGSILPTKIPDMDNICKSVLDAIQKYAFENDKQVVQLDAVKMYSTDPKLIVEIVELENKTCLLSLLRSLCARLARDVECP